MNQRSSKTSTGHEASEASWLDLHFVSSRSEYEAAFRSVPIRPDWSVLDAGCGGGSFLPLLLSQLNHRGSLTCLDLAPENIARVEALLDIAPAPCPVTAICGSVLDLPFGETSFDCVWSANVVQYLSEAQFFKASEQTMRVLKPGGLYAVKEFDAHMLHIGGLDRALFQRFMDHRLRAFEIKGILGTACGSRLSSLLRRAGWHMVSNRGYMVERWAPDVGEFTVRYVESLLRYFAQTAPFYDLPEDDQRAWQAIGRDPQMIISRDDFCYREVFVLSVAKKAS